MALFIWTDTRRKTMETRYEPAPRKDSAAKRPAQAPTKPEAARHDLPGGRVSVLTDKRDEDEKEEAGYGHGV